MKKKSNKNNFLIISIGAIPAAIFRWQIDQYYIVNIIGCFLLGIINNLYIHKKYKLLFGFAFCGSLTTFSGWSFHMLELISKGFYKEFFFSSMSIIIFGLFAVLLGHFSSNAINKLLK